MYVNVSKIILPVFNGPFYIGGLESPVITLLAFRVFYSLIYTRQVIIEILAKDNLFYITKYRSLVSSA